MCKKPKKPKTKQMKQKQPTKSPKQNTPKFQPFFFPECHSLHQQDVALHVVHMRLRQPTRAFRTRSVHSDAVMTPLPAAQHHRSGLRVQPGPPAPLPPSLPSRRARTPASRSSWSHHHQDLLCFAQGEVNKTWRALWSWTSHQDRLGSRGPWGAQVPLVHAQGWNRASRPRGSSSGAAAAAVPARLPPRSAAQAAVSVRQAAISILGKQRFWQCNVLFPALPLSLQPSSQDNHVLPCIQDKYRRNTFAVLIHHYATEAETNLILNPMNKYRERISGWKLKRNTFRLISRDC